MSKIPNSQTTTYSFTDTGSSYGMTIEQNGERVYLSRTQIISIISRYNSLLSRYKGESKFVLEPIALSVVDVETCPQQYTENRNE